MERLYVVGRADLPPGLRAAQLVHAARVFAAEHAELERGWYETSNNLVLLEVADERALFDLAKQADGIPISFNREPDLDGEVTAIALGDRAKRLVRHLPLALAG